jgi:DNA invertase Pin-like site-specific DNA recombinase
MGIYLILSERCAILKAAKKKADCKKTVGYLRVSTVEQDLKKNRHEILELANTKGFAPVTWVEEKVSGIKSWRERKIKQVIDGLGDGDRLIVPELSRLGRSMLEIMEMLPIAKDKGINIYAVKGDWELNGTLQSKVMAAVFSIAAEIERDLISMRTKEGLRARKAMGIKLGRPRGPGRSKLDEHREEIVALLKNGSSKTYVAKKYGTSLPNLYNWLTKNELDPKPDL